MKKQILGELNERFKDCPVEENHRVYEGQRFHIISHFCGEKNLDEALYEIAFRQALEDMENC